MKKKDNEIIEVIYINGEKKYFKNIKHNFFTKILNNSYIFMFLYLPFKIIKAFFYTIFNNLIKLLKNDTKDKV